jgi:glucose uptake protein GlcU
LKVGVFSSFSLQQFLFIIAVLGALIYVGCAFLFQKKAQSKSEEKSIAKGLVLKRTV